MEQRPSRSDLRDADEPEFKSPADAEDTPDIGCVEVSGQSERSIVCQLYRLFFRFETKERSERPEYFLKEDVGFATDIRKDRSFMEMTALRTTLVNENNPRAVFPA